MAGKAKRHLVDGEWITVQQAADRLGLNSQQLYMQMHYRKCGLQAAVNLIRENLALGGHGHAGRHMVDGQWMTVQQAADMLGVTRSAVRSYMYSHHTTLAETVDAYRSGAVVRGGTAPKLHRVGGKMMTAAQAAEMLGIDVLCLRLHMSRHGASLAQTIKYYQKKKQKKAEKDILNILGF